MNKLGMGTAGLTLALGGLLLAPQVASATTAQPAAAYGCSGTQVGSWALSRVKGGTVYGHAYLYYSSASGGTNCAVYVTDYKVGTKRWMDIDMSKTGQAPIADVGNYAQYAGPIKLTQTDGHCMILGWSDSPPGTGFTTSGGVNGVACGS